MELNAEDSAEKDKASVNLRKHMPIPELPVKPRASSTIQSGPPDADQKIVWQRPHRRNSIISPSSEGEKKMAETAALKAAKLAKKEEKKRLKEEQKQKLKKKLKKDETKQKKSKVLSESESSGTFEASNDESEGVQVIDVVTESDPEDEEKGMRSKELASDSDQAILRRGSFRQSWDFDWNMGDKKKSICVETSDLNGPETATTDIES